MIMNESNTPLYIGRTKRSVDSRIQEHYTAASRLHLFPTRDLVLATHYDTLHYDVIFQGLSDLDAK
jgi:predicted GIY-YIG superfamily endonuclease